MNLEIWIIVMAIVGCGIGYCAAKYSWPLRKTFGLLALVLAVSAWLLLDDTPSFTGNPEKDAEVLFERIDKGDEPKEKVYMELKSFYVKHGYTTKNYDEAIRIYTVYWAGNNPTKEEE